MSFIRPVTGVYLFLALLISPASAQVVSDGVDVPELQVFDQAMLQFMQDHNIPDGQLAMTWQGRLVLARAYDNHSENSVDVHTRFRIASVSKPLTSTLMHRLQQDGKLSLDDTIEQYLDLTPYGSRTADPMLKDITVRNLLQHLGGFGSPAELGFDPAFNDAQLVESMGVNYPVLKSDHLLFMNGRRLTHEPGTTFAYSNYGYMLAGLVIEAASGYSYGAYADSLFNGIGIYDARQARSQEHRKYRNETTYWSGTAGPTVMDHSGQLLPYEYGALNYENIGALGGWTISSVELARWLANLDDPDATAAILNPDSTELMFTLPENWTGFYNPGDYYYSSGWGVRDYGNGNRNTFHNGSLPGVTSYAVRIQDGWNYAVTLNRRNESSPGDYVGELDGIMWTARNQINEWPDHDLFSQSLRATPDLIGAEVSGSWYDPTHDGEGFVVQLVDPHTAVVYWFTYSEAGTQRWYFGIASIDGHRLVISTLYETSGGRFGPEFDPNDVQLTPAGSLVLSFYDDASGKADYLLHGESGYQELTRLTRPFTGSRPELIGDWRNGLWYDPSHNGEGYVVEVLPDGQVVIYWFTYDNEGRPAWMIGTADAANLEAGVLVMMQRPEQGNFGVAFDPSKVQRLPNGNATIRIGCKAPAQAKYSDGGASFPDVTLSLVRLAGYIAPPCP